MIDWSFRFKGWFAILNSLNAIFFEIDILKCDILNKKSVIERFCFWRIEIYIIKFIYSIILMEFGKTDFYYVFILFFVIIYFFEIFLWILNNKHEMRKNTLTYFSFIQQFYSSFHFILFFFLLFSLKQQQRHIHWDLPIKFKSFPKSSQLWFQSQKQENL